MNYFISDRSITVVLSDGKTYVMEASHPKYMEVKAGIIGGTLLESDLQGIFNYKKRIEEFSDGVFSIDGNTIVYKKGTPDEVYLKNGLTDRIIKFLDDNLPVEYLLSFLDNLMQNPSKQSIIELFNFLEYNNLPVTEDGCFLAYKVVSSEYLDKHSRTINNAVGAVVSMDRDSVDKDRRNTCSYGLHFASLRYVMDQFYSLGDHVMVLKILPKDVVSIPEDYNNQKGRCARYEVIDEIQPSDERITHWVVNSKNRNSYVRNTPGIGTADYDDEDEYYENDSDYVDDEYYEDDDFEDDFEDDNDEVEEDISTNVATETPSIYPKVFWWSRGTTQKRGYLIGNVRQGESFTAVWKNILSDLNKNLPNKKLALGFINKIQDVSVQDRAIVLLVHEDGEKLYDGVNRSYRVFTPATSSVKPIKHSVNW